MQNDEDVAGDGTVSVGVVQQRRGGELAGPELLDLAIKGEEPVEEDDGCPDRTVSVRYDEHEVGDDALIPANSPYWALSLGQRSMRSSVLDDTNDRQVALTFDPNATPRQRYPCWLRFTPRGTLTSLHSHCSINLQSLCDRRRREATRDSRSLMSAITAGIQKSATQHGIRHLLIIRLRELHGSYRCQTDRRRWW